MGWGRGEERAQPKTIVATAKSKRYNILYRLRNERLIHRKRTSAMVILWQRTSIRTVAYAECVTFPAHTSIHKSSRAHTSNKINKRISAIAYRCSANSGNRKVSMKTTIGDLSKFDVTQIYSVGILIKKEIINVIEGLSLTTL